MTPLVGSDGGPLQLQAHAFPTRGVPSNVTASAAHMTPRSASPPASVLSLSPRIGTAGATAPPADSLGAGVALTRGWHINTGQRGLARLKRIEGGAGRPLPSIATRVV